MIYFKLYWENVHSPSRHRFGSTGFHLHVSDLKKRWKDFDWWRVFPLTEKEKKLNLMQSFSEEIDGEEIVASLTACWSLTAAAGVPEPEYSMRKRCGSEWARDFSSLSLSLYTATDSRSFLHFRLHITYNWGRKLSFHPPRPWQGNSKCNALG